MAVTSPASSIAAAKTTEDTNNDDQSVTSTTSDDNLSPSEKRSLAAKKGWERKRELEKNARSSSKRMRIVSSRSKRAAAKIAAAAIASPAEPKSAQVKSKTKAGKHKGKSAGSAKALKGWETRKKKAAAAAAAASSVASPASSLSSSSSKPKSLTHSEAAKLGWERIRKKKAEEEAKAKAAAASKKKSSATSNNKAGALSRSEAAKLGWERIRAKRVKDASESEEEDDEEDDDVFKARSQSSKKGWETRKKKKIMQTKKAEAAAKAKEAKNDLFVVRSKSSKKGWETRRKMAEAAAKQEEEDAGEWQQRSNASKKGWETRRRLEAEAADGGKKKSVTKADKDTMSDWERKRKMQEMSDETSPEESPVSIEKPKKKYTATARSKAAEMAWQNSRDQKTLIANTATAPSGRAYYQLGSPVATQTYTAERVEWEIRQKMLAAANAEDSSSDEESEEETTSGVEDSTEEEQEEGSDDRPAANISRDEAANLLLAMFGNSAPAAPAAVKSEEISADETSQETSIAEALQELKGVKSEDTSYSVENHGQDSMIASAQEVEETSLRGRKRKPSVKGSGYKHMMNNEDELTPFVRAQSMKSSGGNVAVKPAAMRYPPRSPPRSSVPKAATKKTSKQRSNTAKQGWQKRKNEVFKKPNFDPMDNEKIDAAIAAVDRFKNLQNDAPLPRGVTVRPSGKWQAQLYYAGKSRYIGVFDNRADACYAYEIARQILINCRDPQEGEVEVNISLARKAAFAGVSKY